MRSRDRGLARVRPSARIVLGALTLLIAGCGAAAPLRADSVAGDGAPIGPAPAPVTSAPPTAPHATRGVVLLVRTPRHLVAALETADTLRASDTTSGTRPIHVIACGDAIESVLRDAAAEPRLRAAVARGTVVTACGMSLEEKGIDPARLSAAVTLVPNGLIEAIRLQEAGFVSIEL